MNWGLCLYRSTSNSCSLKVLFIRPCLWNRTVYLFQMYIPIPHPLPKGQYPSTGTHYPLQPSRSLSYSSVFISGFGTKYQELQHATWNENESILPLNFLMLPNFLLSLLVYQQIDILWSSGLLISRNKEIGPREINCHWGAEARYTVSEWKSDLVCVFFFS